MTNSATKEAITGRGRGGTVYTTQDRETWQSQIRQVQDRTFASDNTPVEHHDREAAFHQAAARIVETANPARESGSRLTRALAGLGEHDVTAAAVRAARDVSGYRSRRFYVWNVALVSVATGMCLWLWFGPLPAFTNPSSRSAEVTFVPPTDPELLSRIGNYGTWAVAVIVTIMTFCAAGFAAIGYLSTLSQHEQTALVRRGGRYAVDAMLVAAVGMAIVAVAMGAAYTPVPIT